MPKSDSQRQTNDVADNSYAAQDRAPLTLEHISPACQSLLIVDIIDQRFQLFHVLLSKL